jgi:hypothetical protein
VKGTVVNIGGRKGRAYGNGFGFGTVDHECIGLESTFLFEPMKPSFEWIPSGGNEMNIVYYC